MDKNVIKFRKKLDRIDGKIIDLLKVRFRVVKRFVDYKKSKGMVIEDTSREKEIKERYIAQGFSKKFIDGFFGLLFKRVKN